MWDASGCDLCGNGVLDVGEECEADDLNGATCEGGAGLPTCAADCTVDRSNCTLCGNGKVDGLDEECDPGLDGDDIAIQIACTALVSPAGVSRPYGSGLASKCTSKCLWDRSKCSYCNNHQLDGAAPVDFDGSITLEPEICDDQTADMEALYDHCSDVCGSNYRVECKYVCATNCLDFDVNAVPQGELECCTAKGEACSFNLAGDLLPGRSPCCWALDNPGDPQPCQDIFTEDTKTKRVCR